MRLIKPGTAGPMSLSIPLNTRIWIGGHDRRARAVIEPLLAEAIRPPDGPIDRLILTPLTADEATYFADKNFSRLTAAGELWLVIQEASPTNPRSAFAEWMQTRNYIEVESAPLDDGFVVFMWRRDLTPPPANSTA